MKLGEAAKTENYDERDMNKVLYGDERWLKVKIVTNMYCIILKNGLSKYNIQQKLTFPLFSFFTTYCELKSSH